jgi:hypothetical protein
MSQELRVPSVARRDVNARELVRVWAAEGGQHVCIATGVWKDPGAWGIMLVDLAKHIAAAYEQTQMFSASEALARIKSGFDAEWSVPTSDVTGSVEPD